MTNLQPIKLYLCGAMNYPKLINRYDEAISWRIELTRKLTELNREKGYIKYQWFDPTINFEENDKVANSKTIVQQNDFYLERCDIIIANLAFLHKSPGSVYEIFKYKFLGKPVIVFGDNSWISSPHISESITVHLDNIDDVVNYLENFYHS